MQWRKQSAWGCHTRQLCLTMVIRQNNCWHVVDTCCSSQQISGQKAKKQRAEILFEQYHDLREAYSLAHSIGIIFSKNTIKDAARLSLARWYNKVGESGFKSFNVIAATLYEHYDVVLNFFVNRSTNAFAESFNAKIKAFRAAVRGVVDIKFFMFRLSKIYA